MERVGRGMDGRRKGCCGRTAATGICKEKFWALEKGERI